MHADVAGLNLLQASPTPKEQSMDSSNQLRADALPGCKKTNVAMPNNVTQPDSDQQSSFPKLQSFNAHLLDYPNQWHSTHLKILSFLLLVKARIWPSYVRPQD